MLMSSAIGAKGPGRGGVMMRERAGLVDARGLNSSLWSSACASSARSVTMGESEGRTLISCPEAENRDDSSSCRGGGGLIDLALILSATSCFPSAASCRSGEAGLGLTDLPVRLSTTPRCAGGLSFTGLALSVIALSMAGGHVWPGQKVPRLMFGLRSAAPGAKGPGRGGVMVRRSVMPSGEVPPRVADIGEASSTGHPSSSGGSPSSSGSANSGGGVCTSRGVIIASSASVGASWEACNKT
mmetsp:Transcript_29023/g.83172  ORF Transcript_29023/g.83172 Transcript_29023/m.83172 type:complete len:242 (+) Transcript_29023:293-1018(+)